MEEKKIKFTAVNLDGLLFHRTRRTAQYVEYSRSPSLSVYLFPHTLRPYAAHTHSRRIQLHCYRTGLRHFGGSYSDVNLTRPTITFHTNRAVQSWQCSEQVTEAIILLQMLHLWTLTPLWSIRKCTVSVPRIWMFSGWTNCGYETLSIWESGSNFTAVLLAAKCFLWNTTKIVPGGNLRLLCL